MILERLCDLFILHRGLDPNDEDSTVEEQAEKLLYILSKDAGDANERVQLTTTIEALMELSKSFMGKPLETTIMNNKTWTFYECEPGIWLVLSMKNDHIAAVENGVDLELTSSYGCRLFLSRLYSLLHNFIGSMQTYLVGADGQGWDCIQRMISAKKNVRKTQMKLGNAQNDLEKLQEDQRQGIHRDGMEELLRQSDELISDLKSKLASAQGKLALELASPSYRLPQLKEKLSSFMVWYLSIEDFNNVSCLTSTFNAMEGKLRDRTAAGSIHRLMRHVQQALPQLQLHCMLTFENRVLWTDVDASTTTNLLDFLVRWDSSFLVSQPNLKLRKAMQDFAKSIYQETRCDYSSLDTQNKAKVVESVRELEDRKRQRIGVMTQRGHYISFDKYSIRLPSIQRISELRSRGMTSVPEEERASASFRCNQKKQVPLPFLWPTATSRDIITNSTSPSARKRLAQGLTFFDSLDMGDGNSIVCSPVYSPSESTEVEQEQPLSRAMFLFFGRLVLTVIIPTEQLEALYSLEFQALIWSYTTPQLSLPPLPSTLPLAKTDIPFEEKASASAGNATSETVHTNNDVVAPSAVDTTPVTGDTNLTNNPGVGTTTTAAQDTQTIQIPAMQINSIRMSRLVEKLETLVHDTWACQTSSTEFHEYDDLALLQTDIAKLKLMYIAKKIRDAIANDALFASDSTTAIGVGVGGGVQTGMRKLSVSGAGAGAGAGSSGHLRHSNLSPTRSMSVSYLASSGSGSGSSAANVMTPPTMLSMRRDTGSSSSATVGDNTGFVEANAMPMGSSGGGVQSQWFIQLQQAQWLVQRSSAGCLRGMLHPKITLLNNQERDIRAACVSPNYCAIKMFNVDSDSVLHQLFQPDYGLISTASSSSLSPIQQDAALDRYFLSQSRYSEPALLLVQCVLHQFGAAVTRAVHDIWSRLVPIPAPAHHHRSAEHRGHHQQGHLNGFITSQGKYHALATRISTPQRGGVWVVGSHLVNQTPLLAVVTNCATFDEVMEVFDVLAQEATS